MKPHSYYAPISIFFIVFLYFVVAGFVIVRSFQIHHVFSPLIFFTLLLILGGLLFERIVRLSYHIKIENGIIHECGFFTAKRSMRIDSIIKINWKKEYVWTRSYTFGGGGEASLQKRFYIRSVDTVFPKYAVTRRLAKDMKKLRPDLVPE